MISESNHKKSDSKASLLESSEIRPNPLKESHRSRISTLSSCFRSSNSSLESLESQPKSSKASLVEKNSNTSKQSSLKSSDSTYILALEKEYESLQVAFFAVTSHFAKVQFRLRQIIQAKPDERDRLLDELTQVTFCGIDGLKFTNMPQMKKDLEYMGNIRRRQGHLIDRLRSQMEYLAEDRIPETDNEATQRKTVRIDKTAKE